MEHNSLNGKNIFPFQGWNKADVCKFIAVFVDIIIGLIVRFKVSVEKYLRVYLNE